MSMLYGAGLLGAAAVGYALGGGCKRMKFINDKQCGLILLKLGGAKELEEAVVEKIVKKKDIITPEELDQKTVAELDSDDEDEPSLILVAYRLPISVTRAESGPVIILFWNHPVQATVFPALMVLCSLMSCFYLMMMCTGQFNIQWNDCMDFFANLRSLAKTRRVTFVGTIGIKPENSQEMSK